MTRISTKDLAAMLGMSVQTVRCLAKAGQIPALMIRGEGGVTHYYFYKEHLVEKGILKA